MLNSVNYTDNEKRQIENKIKEAKFSANSWSDKDLNNLKLTIKNHYLDSQNYTCPYCRQQIKSGHSRNWDIEHIIPRSTQPNFMFEPLNLCMSCVECNSAKSDKKVTNSNAKLKYPNKSTSYLIVHPHLDTYSDNILVIKEGFYYVALKPKGERTIELCKLNRFYKFSKFGQSVDDDERIFLLSEKLKRTEDEKMKKEIRKNIAALAINGSA